MKYHPNIIYTTINDVFESANNNSKNDKNLLSKLMNRGKDRNNVEHEYDVRNIQSLDSFKVRRMKERIHRAYKNALSNMGLLNDETEGSQQ